MAKLPRPQNLALGVLIALTAVASTALIIDSRLSASRGVTTASAAVVSPAAISAPVAMGNTVTVVGQGSAIAVPDQAQLSGRSTPARRASA